MQLVRRRSALLTVSRLIIIKKEKRDYVGDPLKELPFWGYTYKRSRILRDLGRKVIGSHTSPLSFLFLLFSLPPTPCRLVAQGLLPCDDEDDIKSDAQRKQVCDATLWGQHVAVNAKTRTHIMGSP